MRGDFGAAKGEIRRAGRAVHRAVRQPTGVWYLTTDGKLSSTSVEGHLLYLLERIEPVGEKLAQLVESSSLTADFYATGYLLQARAAPRSVLRPSVGRRRARCLCQALRFAIVR
jgi:hypothetical protein